MIAVKRTEEPQVLKANAASWLETLKRVKAAPTSTPLDIDKAERKYRHRSVKNALKVMFHGKCAFCEVNLVVTDYGDVEHFRPKSRFIDDTFRWTNLLFSCKICNNSDHKGTKFPVDEEGNPLLIDPTDEKTDINRHLEFFWDPEEKSSEVWGRDARGIKVEEIFDLNGERGRTELVQHRNKYLEFLDYVLRDARNGDLEALNIARKSCRPDAEYSAFAIALCTRYGIPQS